MKRRHVLGAVATGAATLAGCVGSPSGESDPGDSDGTPTTESTGTPTSTEEPTADPTEDPTADPTADSGYRTLSVETVENVTETITHALRLNDLGTSPHGDVPTPAELTDRKRGVIETALSGSYETDSPPDWLADFVGSTPFVRVDGEYYRLENTLPTYTITAEAVPESAVSGEIADADAYEDAVTHDGLVMTGLVRIARREGIEFAYLWPSLREFLDGYDALRYRGDLVSLSVSVADPGAPYAVTAERIPPAGLTEEGVWNAEDAPADLREIVATAAGVEGVYGVRDPPGKLLSRLRANQYVYFDGHFYTTYVERRGPVPVSLSASFTDATLDDDGATLELTLHSEADREVSVTSGAPAPFGILRYRPEGSDGSETLWSEAYAESGHVQTDGHEVGAVNSIALATELGAGESVGETFVVEDTSLSPGTYVVEGSVGVDVPDGEGGTYTYRIVFAVE